MNLAFWIGVGIVTTLCCLIIALALKPEPLRNGYQLRQRTRIKGAGVTIIEPKDDPRIVGDDTRPPNSALIRDLYERVEM